MNKPPLNRTPILISNEHCETGENPLWDHTRRSLYWTDIPAGKVFRYDFDTGTHANIYRGAPVGGFTMQADGSLLLFRVNDVVALLPDQRERERALFAFDDPGAERFNDVIADPEGRVFAGTRGHTKESGGLFRIDRDGTITNLIKGTRTANGMGFSPDLRTLYWTDSTAKRIYRFDYDRATGGISNQTLFYQATPTEGTPDGLAVDTQGNVWSAHWDGWQVFKHAPSGKVLERFTFPVAKISSVCFGGDDLRTLFVTTAGGRSGANTADGAVFQLDVDAQGVPEFQSRVMI
jgi:D-xylono/L-arabinono-1,4-lactonase